MSIYLGNTEIGHIYLGNTEISEAYLGSTKVYEAGVSPTPILPTGYTQLNWLTNTGGAWFKSGIQRDSTSQLIDIETRIKVLVGGYMGTDSGCFFRADNGYWFNLGTNTNVPCNLNEEYSILMYRDDINSQSLYINGTNTGSVARTLSGTKDVYMFNILNSTTYQFKCSLGRTKIYKARDLVADFVPCIDPNNVYGMYCLIRESFYTSMTATPFTGD